MIAFQSNWTKPFFEKHDGYYYIEDFELLTTILSALEWRKHNGSIKMVTDNIGCEYYNALGLSKIWDLGIQNILDEVVDQSIDPYTYWAAGKLYALQAQEEPCAMIDTDFIVWDSVEETLNKHPVAVIHREKLDKMVYPSKEVFKMKDDYIWDETLNWQTEPCNTAFLYLGNKKFKDFYTHEAINFMKGTIGRDHLIYMVFAEQRLLSMCAQKSGIELFSFAEQDELFKPEQKLFTHVWGYKRHLLLSTQAREKFCRRCIRRILLDFPHMLPIIEKIDSIKPYLY